MVLINEIWKDIPNYEGLYQVSNLGRVKSLERLNEKNGNQLLKERLLKIIVNKYRLNYCQVGLSKNRKVKMYKVHRLVLSTFNPIENMENLQVGHKDGNPQNNSLDNLYWCTPKENMNHPLTIQRLKNSGVKIKVVIDNIEYIFNTILQASKELNINRGTLYNGLKNKSKVFKEKNIKVCYI